MESKPQPWSGILYKYRSKLQSDEKKYFELEDGSLRYYGVGNDGQPKKFRGSLNFDVYLAMV